MDPCHSFHGQPATRYSFMSIRSYRDLEVWQKAVDVATESYRLARHMPDSERFVLVPQIYRAAASIAANIAEGHERRSTREFLRHVSIARGSLAELDTFFELAERLKYLTGPQLGLARQLADDVSRMLSRLRQALSARPPRLASRAPRP